MAKQNFGEAIGKCSVCTINLWDASDGEPAIWPCNVKDCPYESPDHRHTHNQIHYGSVGSGLGQIDF